MRSLANVLAVIFLAAAWKDLRAQSNPAVKPDSPTTVPVSPPALAGTWDATIRSYGGIGSTVLLSDDAVFTLVLGAMVEMKYKVDGDRLTFYSEQGGRNSSETQTLKFVGDTATISSGRCSVKLIPLETPVTQGTLVGRWRFMHMTGVPAYEEFSADGLSRLRVPIQVRKGTYKVTGNTIAFHVITPRQEDWTAQFTIDADVLTLTGPTGTNRYIRSQPLIPMAVQQPAPPIRLLC